MITNPNINAVSNISSYSQKLLRLDGSTSSNIVGVWPLSEERGTVAYDIGPNQYDATSSAIDRTNTFRSFRAPDGSRAARFDGTSSFVNIYSALPASATTEGTIGAWVALDESQLSGTTKAQVIMVGADTANQLGIYFDTTANRYSCDYFAGAADATYSTTYGAKVWNTPYVLQHPKWHHLCVTYSATNDQLVLYVNSESSTIATGLGSWTGVFASTLCVIGQSKTNLGDPLKGYVSNVAWYSSAFTPEQVRGLYKVP